MIFGTALRALKWLKVLNRCEKAFKQGLEKPMSKTKIGAIVGGIGLLLVIVASVLTGSTSVVDALPQAMKVIGEVIAVIGGATAVIGGRNAATKVIAAIKDGK